MRIYHSYRSTPAIVTAGATLLLSMFLQACTPAAPGEQESSSTSSMNRVSLTGTTECLPHKDTSGPHTMECAFGLEASDGRHYALDTSLVQTDLFSGFETGMRVQVEGAFVPLMALSSDQWQTYDIQGIVRVSSASQL